ncbi:MAG: hypothetical protein ACK6BC_01275 [Cyanobacteriota bacterium]
MGELSDRFGELMARLAKGDADIYRTIGAQNARVRQLVDEHAPAAPEAPLPPASPRAAAALPPAGLLPPDACELKALKARFGKLAEAQAWLEEQIGQAPKKPTWDVIVQTCRAGAWPVSASRGATVSKGLTALELEQRLSALEQRLEQRFNRLEGLLTVLVAALEAPP